MSQHKELQEPRIWSCACKKVRIQFTREPLVERQDCFCDDCNVRTRVCQDRYCGPPELASKYNRLAPNGAAQCTKILRKYLSIVSGEEEIQYFRCAVLNNENSDRYDRSHRTMTYWAQCCGCLICHNGFGFLLEFYSPGLDDYTRIEETNGSQKVMFNTYCCEQVGTRVPDGANVAISQGLGGAISCNIVCCSGALCTFCNRTCCCRGGGPQALMIIPSHAKEYMGKEIEYIFDKNYLKWPSMVFNDIEFVPKQQWMMEKLERNKAFAAQKKAITDAAVQAAKYESATGQSKDGVQAQIHLMARQNIDRMTTAEERASLKGPKKTTDVDLVRVRSSLKLKPAEAKMAKKSKKSTGKDAKKDSANAPAPTVIVIGKVQAAPQDEASEMIAALNGTGDEDFDDSSEEDYEAQLAKDKADKARARKEARAEKNHRRSSRRASASKDQASKMIAALKGTGDEDFDDGFEEDFDAQLAKDKARNEARDNAWLAEYQGSEMIAAQKDFEAQLAKDKARSEARDNAWLAQDQGSEMIAALKGTGDEDFDDGFEEDFERQLAKDKARNEASDNEMIENSPPQVPWMTNDLLEVAIAAEDAGLIGSDSLPAPPSRAQPEALTALQAKLAESQKEQANLMEMTSAVEDMKSRAMNELEASQGGSQENAEALQAEASQFQAELRVMKEELQNAEASRSEMAKEELALAGAQSELRTTNVEEAK